MTDLSPETNPLGKHKAELPDPDNPNLEAQKPENGDALVDTIQGGIDDARERRGDITEHTARAVAASRPTRSATKVAIWTPSPAPAPATTPYSARSTSRSITTRRPRLRFAAGSTGWALIS